MTHQKPMGISDVCCSVYPPKKLQTPGLNIKQDKKEIPHLHQLSKVCIRARTNFVSEIVHILGLKLNPICATTTLQSAHPFPTYKLQKKKQQNKTKEHINTIQKSVSRQASKYSKFTKLEFKLQTSFYCDNIYSPLVTELCSKNKRRNLYNNNNNNSVFASVPLHTVCNDTKRIW